MINGFQVLQDINNNSSGMGVYNMEYEMDLIELESDLGERASSYYFRCIELASRTGQRVNSKFNDVEIRVSPNSCEADILYIFHLRYKLKEKS